MNLRHVLIVFKKEVKDIARDKKTLITTLVVPIILFPVLFGLIGNGVQNLEKRLAENITIALSEASNTQDTKEFVEKRLLAGNSNITLSEITGDPIQAVQEEKVTAVLEFEKDYKMKLENNEPFTIKVLYDNSKLKSSEGASSINDVINTFNQAITKERLAKLGIDPVILEPSRVEQVNVADEKKSGSSNMMLLMIVPMLVSILIAVGGIPAATDLVAGEKERATFEPLLTTRPSRISILLGKYLTVTLFSFISVVAQFAGMVAGFLVNPSYLTMGSQSDTVGGISIPPLAFILSLLITVTLGMVFAGIQLAISTYAKSFKEAQTYLSFLIFIAMIPAYATMMMQPSEIQAYMFVIPVLNAIAALKMVLGGVINYTNLLIALATSVIYVAISLVFSARLFNKEKFLFRS